MLDRYYSYSFFRTCLLIYLLVSAQSFSMWYISNAETGSIPWPVLLLLYVGLATIVLFPSKKVRLPRPYIPFIVMATLWLLQLALIAVPHNITLSTSFWPILCILLVSIGLMLRHHHWAAWAVFIFSSALVVSWHSTIHGPYKNVLLYFLIPFILMVASQTMTFKIKDFQLKAAESQELLENAQHRSIQEQGASSSSERRVREVRDLTEDMLHRIAFNPAPVTREEIDQFRFAEAQLRDTIRGRNVVNEQILRAAFEARQRGAKVDILDERGEPLPEKIAQLLTEAAVDLLEDASAGTVTIRAFPSDDTTAVMLVHDGNNDDEEDAVAIEISRDGEIERF